jgi:hypothetical protein
MKKKIFALAILTSLLASCTGDLDIVPVSALTGNNFYKTDNDAIIAVNGVYSSNSYLSNSLDYIIDGASDAVQSGEAVQGDGGANLPNFKYDAGNSTVASVWRYLFEGIASAGAVIDGIEASGNSSAIKTRAINEAKFLRALYYFYAVQLWGDVPLVLHPDEGDNVTRASIDDVYAQIVADLEAAKALPASTSYASSDRGRASRGAAWGLLSKAYLVWKQTSPSGAPADSYAKSVEAADKVIEFGDYELLYEYVENWKWGVGERDGKEILFSSHHAVPQFFGSEGFNHMTHCAFAEGFSNPYATNHLAITNRSFYDIYDPADQRREGSYIWKLKNPKETDPATPGYDEVTFRLPLFRKAINVDDPVLGSKSRDLDRIILRYADIFLIKAEALNELGRTAEAYGALNIVRRRAFKQALNQPSSLVTPIVNETNAGLYDTNVIQKKGGNPVDLTGDAAKFKSDIQRERLFEFVYEQQRWFDLVRWKILVKTVKQNIPVEASWKWNDPENHGKGGEPVIAYTKENVSLRNYLFPIPQTERSKNPGGLWQNWGYDGATGNNPYEGKGYE